MVTTTTKTLNYSITKGNQTNSVNATITSTPGFNSNYLGKIPGIFHVLEVILAAIALGLVAALRRENRTWIQVEGQATQRSYLSESFLVGDPFFFCAQSAILTVLVIMLLSYLFHTTSAMIVPKATTLENTAHLVLALLSLAAGIVEIVMTEIHKWDNDRGVSIQVIDTAQEAQRLAAGAIAILNGLLLIGSYVQSRKELAGPKAL